MSAKLPAAELGWVRHARASLRESQRLLTSPSAATIEDVASHIEAASGCLEALRDSLRSVGARPAPAQLAAEVSELRDQIARASTLLEAAARFHFGWTRLLYAAACGYTARGEPAAPGPVRRLSMEG